MKAIIVVSACREVDPVRIELINWAQSLGVNTKKALPLFVLAQVESGAWQAHFSIKRGPDGNPDGPDLVLQGTNRVQADYGCKVVEVAEGSWPRWFPVADDVPDAPVSLLLELLAVTESAGLELKHRLRGHERMGY